MSIADEVRAVNSPGPEPESYRESGFDRTPPQDIAAEQSVLGGMLLSKDAIADVVEILRTADFYRPAHATIFDAILDLYGRGEPADPVMVAAALTDAGELIRVGGAPYLHTLMTSVPTAANASYYARIVAERAVLRRLVEAGTRIVQMGYGSAAGQGRDVDDIVDLAQQAIYDVTERRSGDDFAILADLLQPALDEIEAVGARDGMMAGVPTGFGDLDRLLNGLHPGQLIVVAGRPGLGKALALDTPLPTPDGWTSMGEVRVGDRLLDADGRPTTVVALSEVMLGRPCFEVEFSDGSVIVADGEHRWLTRARRARRTGAPAAVRTTDEIRATLRTPVGGRRPNHAVATTAPLDLPARDLPVAPYTLGAWLGDGHPAGARFTSVDPEISMYVEADGYLVTPCTGSTYTVDLPARPGRTRVCVDCGQSFPARGARARRCGRPCGGRARAVLRLAGEACVDCGACKPEILNPDTRCADCCRRYGSLTGWLRSAGVLHDKHIPAEYLRASLAQRRALLAGLLDTEGQLTESGKVRYTTTSPRLAAGVRELIVSLGYRCRQSTAGGAWTLTFSTVDDVFRLERKRLVHKDRRHATPAHRHIVDVRPVPSVPVRCVSVDNAEHLYLAGSEMIPTHNSTVSMDFARNAAVRHNMASAIFSLEMSKIEIVTRLLSAEARVPLHVLRSGQLSDDDWTRLARRMGEISEAPIFVDDTPNMTLMEIRAKARRMRQRNELKLVVVDYLQLMTSPKRTESRQQEVADLSRGLKLLAKEIECPVVAVSQLNRGPEQRTDKRPQLSDLRESGCLPASTRVVRADTNVEVTLGELLTGSERDIPVWALDGKLKYVPATMTHVFATGIKPVFRLRLRSGREIEATGNHKFLTIDGWMPLEQLAPGARLAAPRHIPAPLELTPWSDERVVLLAHLLGDGSFVKRQPIRYASIDEFNLEAVSDAALTEFGITSIRDDYSAARVTTLRLPAPYRLARGRRNPIAEWLDELGLFGLRPHQKFIPRPVFSLPKAQVIQFIRHLWATDGSVTVLREGRGGRIYYASTSLELVRGLRSLLLRFGISTRLRTVRPEHHRPQYALDISGRDDQLRFLRQIGVHGARSVQCAALREQLELTVSNPNVDTVPREIWGQVREVLAERGLSRREFQAAIDTQYCGSTLFESAPSRSRLAQVAAVLDSADLELHATNDVFWDEVAAIEAIGEQPVYDATVLGLHNFIADGVVVHNSIEQDADVVILLHRDDYYDKESPRAGEADFIVAKHRNGPTDTVTVAAQLHFSRFMDMAIN